MTNFSKNEEPKLVKPSLEYKDSFLEAESEYEKEGKPRHASPTSTFRELETDFEKYLKRVSDDEKGVNMKEGYVPCTASWLVDNGKFIGSVNIRHRLNEHLRNIGGNIGYSIRPSARKNGYGTKILELALPAAKSLGIDKVLITCDDDNIGSAKIIEKNGGVLENKVEHEGKLKRRYWIENK